ncbi:hypothetical protein [Wohlfahrtiimonas chitiniclastica]|uniref:hypothetical protein n=1 Tax=Wohlfahrtiimonas chitiniclastica TaxID=400946 RepID=UPI001BCEDFCB|nr:hypothetical protein [Wohlfahrtiimonas chitiniclastica]MBS7817091.1 hypothetical protein [Wohlfahrtiimonas chitiniclastica]MBS7822705.1 hypothetical protein [Wohlfahrtiimonas chitiniclastica]MBS7830520.1 hypothetical protein [Wohlfahrtiimonas chitiniclastica]MBS7832652.1 hypothetical protein [Wohlfahrtiimonas chitiniclastica]
MRLDQLIQQMNEEPDDIIAFLSAITDEEIQALKNNKHQQELQKLNEYIEDILMMLQMTASGGHLIDVAQLRQLQKEIFREM